MSINQHVGQYSEIPIIPTLIYAEINITCEIFVVPVESL